MSNDSGGGLVQLGSEPNKAKRSEAALAIRLASALALQPAHWALTVGCTQSDVFEGLQPKVVLDHLPGYACRFVAANDGGFWLSFFCSRTQLVEFVRKETEYRQEMMVFIDLRH